MLVLTRKAGESILVGDDIEIVVVEVTGEKIRIGIEAPENIGIVRKELVEAVREENAQASRVEAGAVEGLPKMWDMKEKKK